MGAHPKTVSLYVRCVSGQSKDATLSFTDNSDGTIKDNTTGLIWQKCSMGQTNDATCSGTATTTQWTNAITYCSGLSLAGKTWRLPQANEFISIADTTKTTSPGVDTTAFPAIVVSLYYSSTMYKSDTTQASVANTNDGSMGNTPKSQSWNVRCVTGP